MSDAAAEAETSPSDAAGTGPRPDHCRHRPAGQGHLATQGAAALSLRAVARDLGVVSSAVYRYVANRDELLTLLLVDAYDELGDAVDTAVNAVPARDHAGRFKALGRAVRDWALREPARYGLLFGSPVPGYQAPAGRTTTPGTRVIYRLIGILDGAYRAGALTAAARAAVVPSALSADLEAIRSRTWACRAGRAPWRTVPSCGRRSSGP